MIRRPPCARKNHGALLPLGVISKLLAGDSLTSDSVKSVQAMWDLIHSRLVTEFHKLRRVHVSTFQLEGSARNRKSFA